MAVSSVTEECVVSASVTVGGIGERLTSVGGELSVYSARGAARRAGADHVLVEFEMRIGTGVTHSIVQPASTWR